MRLARGPEEGPFSIWGSWQCTQCNLTLQTQLIKLSYYILTLPLGPCKLYIT